MQVAWAQAGQLATLPSAAVLDAGGAPHLQDQSCHQKSSTAAAHPTFRAALPRKVGSLLGQRLQRCMQLLPLLLFSLLLLLLLLARRRLLGGSCDCCDLCRVFCLLVRCKSGLRTKQLRLCTALRRLPAHTPEAQELRHRPPPHSQVEPPQIHRASATGYCAHRWPALTAAWRGPWTARPALQRRAHRSLLALHAAARRQRALRQALRQWPLRPAVRVCHGAPAGRMQGHGGGCRHLAAVQAGVRGAAAWRRGRVAAAGGRHPCSSRGGSGPFVQDLPRPGRTVEEAPTRTWEPRRGRSPPVHLRRGQEGLNWGRIHV